MKKLVALMLVLMMSLSLVACGGVDKQPIIDTFNATSTAFDAVGSRINANPDLLSQEEIDIMVQMAEVLITCKNGLESDQELDEEQAATLISALEEVQIWVEEVDAIVTEREAAAVEAETAEDALDKDMVIEAFNYVSSMFDSISAVVNENPDDYDEDFIEGMISIANGLQGYKEVLESDVEPTQEELIILWNDMADIEEIMLTLESVVFGE